jgi:hypothetical protein
MTTIVVFLLISFSIILVSLGIKRPGQGILFGAAVLMGFGLISVALPFFSFDFSSANDSLSPEDFESSLYKGVCSGMGLAGKSLFEYYVGKTQYMPCRHPHSQWEKYSTTSTGLGNIGDGGNNLIWHETEPTRITIFDKLGAGTISAVFIVPTQPPDNTPKALLHLVMDIDGKHISADVYDFISGRVWPFVVPFVNPHSIESGLGLTFPITYHKHARMYLKRRDFQNVSISEQDFKCVREHLHCRCVMIYTNA